MDAMDGFDDKYVFFDVVFASNWVLFGRDNRYYDDDVDDGIEFYDGTCTYDDFDLVALCRNDPSLTLVRIGKYNSYVNGMRGPFQRVHCRRAARRTTLQNLTKALRGNTHVTTLQIDICHVDATRNGGANLDIVVDIIQNRRELTSLGLLNCINNFPRSTSMCNRHILAATQNPSIRAIHLRGCRMSAESLLLLFAGTVTVMKLRKLVLAECSVLITAPFDVSSFDLSIVNGAQNSSTLTHLIFAPKNALGEDERYIYAILDGLSRSVQSNLERLELHMKSPPIDLSRAIQGLLPSTTASKLRALRLENIHFTAETFQPLAHGLSHSVYTWKLILQCCHFDRESTLLLDAVFQAGKHSGSLNCLCVENCCFWRHDCANAVFVDPLGHYSSMEKFAAPIQSSADVEIIMQAVAHSPMLELLQLVNVNPGRKYALPSDAIGGQCNILAAYLPGLVTLKSFRFTLRRD